MDNNWNTFFKKYLKGSNYQTGGSNEKGTYKKLQKEASEVWQRGGYLIASSEGVDDTDINLGTVEKPITINKADYAFIDTFINLVFPSVYLKDNYIGYEAVSSLKTLGSGAFGFSARFTDDESNQYLLKIFYPRHLTDPVMLQAIESELKIVSSVSVDNTCESISNTYALFDMKRKLVYPTNLIPEPVKKLYKRTNVAGIIMELGLGDLSDEYSTYVRRTGTTVPVPDAIMYYFLKLFDGLVCLNNKGYVHCDIKPPNLIVTKAEGAMKMMPKLIDFGMCSKLDNRTGYARFTGASPMYLPPELYRHTNNADPGVPTDRQGVTPKMDVWAMTISIFEHFGLIDMNTYIPYLWTNPRQYYADIRARMESVLPAAVAPYNASILLKGIELLKDDRYNPVEMVRYVKAEIDRRHIRD